MMADIMAWSLSLKNNKFFQAPPCMTKEISYLKFFGSSLKMLCLSFHEKVVFSVEYRIACRIFFKICFFIRVSLANSVIALSLFIRIDSFVSILESIAVRLPITNDIK